MLDQPQIAHNRLVCHMFCRMPRIRLQESHISVGEEWTVLIDNTLEIPAEDDFAIMMLDNEP